MGNAATGLVECLYKGHKTRTHLGIGDDFTIEREGIETIITRVSNMAFNVDSHRALPHPTM
jgi:hypothetical protein